MDKEVGVTEQLNDPNFNIVEYIESKNKALAETLFEQYKHVIRRRDEPED